MSTHLTPAADLKMGVASVDRLRADVEMGHVTKIGVTVATGPTLPVFSAGRGSQDRQSCSSPPEVGPPFRRSL